MASMLEGEPLAPPPSHDLAAHFKTFGPRLLAMIDRRLDPSLAHRVEADDILQRTYLKARTRWDKFPQSAMTPFPWLYRLALDALIEAWREENRDCRNIRNEVPWPERSSIQLGLQILGRLTSPQDAAERRELCEGVRNALDAMKPEDREILDMRLFDDLPFREAAMVLEISEEAAMKRYARAVLRFKALWVSLNSSLGGMA
jgi:RNA polymerase sigma-70 factor, ECF subfamily